MSWIIDKFNKICERLNRGWVGKTVDKILTEPEYGWGFLTGVLVLGGFGVICCLLWFYFLIKSGMPWGWIVFDSAIIIFCAWVVIKMIIPMYKEAYKDIDRQFKEKYGDDEHQGTVE